MILVRVPSEVGRPRREQWLERAKDHGRQPSEETLFLANWTILLTTVPTHLLKLPQVLICVRLRWQIERFFRHRKEHGRIDDWRSKKPDRVVSEQDAKICAMLIHQSLVHHGGWHDPHASLFKAGQVLRREVKRLMAPCLKTTWRPR